MFTTRIVFCFACLLLTACTNFIIGEGEGLLDAAVQDGAIKHRIYIATTRAGSDDSEEFFSGERSKDLTLAHVDVTIPANHKPGNIEQPTSGKTNPLKHFAVGLPRLFETPQGFQGSFNSELATKSQDNQDVLVFIHGFNVNFSAAVLRIAQFVNDTGFTGTPVLFSWASRGSTLDYVYDINSALQSRDNLVKLAVILNKTEAKGFDVVAHSMGNLVTIEALRQISKSGNLDNNSKLNRVMMASPDIDIDLFETQLKDFDDIKNLFYVFVSKDDKALAASTKIAGGISRVGVADPERLASLGVNVIDLSNIEDKGSIHHSKFADSPEIVQLIGASIKDGNSLSAQNPQTPGAAIAGGVIEAVTVIPSAIIGGTSSLIVKLDNQ